MNEFNARFDLNYAMLTNYETMDEWEMTGYVVDNTGKFFATDSKEGDVIYINSYDGIKRYIVTEVVSTNPIYTVNVKWDMPEVEPFEPLSGYDGLIGCSTGKLKLTKLTSWTINGLSESFISDIKNYESTLIESGTLSSPALEGEPTATTPDEDSNNNQIATTEWVNNKLKSLAGINCEGEVKNFIAGEDIHKFDLLYLDNNNNVRLCDANNIDCADAIIGFALNDCLAEESVKVLMEGIITNEQWNFEKYPKLLFVGLNGNFIETPNQEYKFLQQIGSCIDSKTINLEIEESIIL